MSVGAGVDRGVRVGVGVTVGHAVAVGTGVAVAVGIRVGTAVGVGTGEYVGYGVDVGMASTVCRTRTLTVASTSGTGEAVSGDAQPKATVARSAIMARMVVRPSNAATSGRGSILNLLIRLRGFQCRFFSGWPWNPA